MKIAPASAVLLFVVSSVAGCLGADDVERPPAGPTTFRWGLGLEIPSTLPPRGDFREPTGQVEYWETFFLRHTEFFLEECPKRFQPGSSEQPLFVRGRFEHLLTACEADRDVVNAIVTEIHNDGNSSKLREVAVNAWASVNATRAQLPNQPVLPNVTSVEVASWLIERVLIHWKTLLALDDAVRDYREDGNVDALRFAVSNYLRISVLSEVVGRIINSMVWDEGQCIASDSDIGNSTIIMYESLIDLGSNNSRLIHNDMTGTFYQLGRVSGHLWQAMRATENGWWPMLYSLSSEIPFFEAYFAYVDAGVVPTFDEALYLQALNENRSRTLFSDWHVFRRQANLDSPGLWREEPEWGLVLLALGHLGWRFGELSCLSTTNPSSSTGATP